MKTKFLFIFLLFQLHHCFGQEVEKEVPYFVMAYSNSFDDIDDVISGKYVCYKKLLFLMDGNKLKVIDTLNAAFPLMMNLITQFEDQKILYFEEEQITVSQLKENESPYYYFSILDYSKNNISLKRYRSDWDSSFLEHLDAIPIIKNKELIIMIEQGENGFDEAYGYDRNFRKYRIFMDDFQNPYIEGHRAFLRSNIGRMTYEYDSSFQVLTIPFSNSLNYHPKALIQEPDSFKRRQDLDLWVIINNERYFVGCDGWNTALPEPYKQELKIYDKKRKIWSRWMYVNTRNFINKEDWLYGSISNFWKTLEEKEKIEEITNKYKYRYDFTFGDMNEIGGYPGILYLYYIPTKMYIEWDTGDPDSEIITIHEDTIYYRVFDEIRTVELDTIKNEINWPSQKLLIKDKKRVPNIHWMFFAPKQDKVEKVWVNRPKN